MAKGLLFQYYRVTKNPTVTTVTSYETFEFLTKYKRCKGYCVVRRSTHTVVDLRIRISNSSGIIQDWVPIEAIEATTNIPLNDRFKECDIEAGGRKLKIEIQSDTAAQVADFDFIFSME
jgi:hypothetical protein